MLALTQNAANAIRVLKDASEEVPIDAGLRISAESAAVEDTATLRLALVEEPEAEDEVVDADGERVYLEPQAAALLGDKVLDAQIAGDRVSFGLSQQASVDGAGPEG